MFACVSVCLSVCLSAALLLVIGQLLYTLGWSSQRVRDVCGDYAGPFMLDQCHIGLFFLLLLMLLLMLFLLLICLFYLSPITASLATFSYLPITNET